MNGLGPLRGSRFRLLWAGQSLSAIGDAVVPITITLVVIGETGSATQLGIVLAASLIAQVALFLPGGVWADRLPRRAVMVGADALRCTVQLIIGLDLIHNGVNVVHLAVAGALNGAANAFFLPATRGLVPATVGRAHLQQANAMMDVSKRLALVLSPAIATGLVLGVGGGWVLVLDSATFALSVVTLSALRITETGGHRSGFLAELRDGWTQVRSRRWYWSSLLVHAVWNMGRCVYFVVGPLIAIGSLGGEVAWGVIVQGSAVGALVGVLMALRMKPRRPLVAVNVCLSLGCLPLLGLGTAAHPVLVSVFAGFMAMGLGITGALWATVVQQNIPANYLSRVTAYDWLLSVGLNPLGMLMAGPLAALASPQWTVLGMAALVAVVCAAALGLPDVRALKSTPTDQPVKEEISG